MRHHDLKIKLINKHVKRFQAYYLAFFFAAGSFSTFFSLYLFEGVNFTKYQIGAIMSTMPFINIFFQPFWGALNAKFRLDKKLVLIAMSSTCLFQTLILTNNQYYKILVFTILYALFNCTITPIQDSITIVFTKKYQIKYTDVRIFGSIGWAMALFLSGLLISLYSYRILVYILIISYFTAFILFTRVKRIKITSNQSTNNKHYSEVLKNKVFLLFLIFGSLSIGVFNSLGSFYNIRIKELGGETSFIGTLGMIIVFVEIVSIMFVTRFNHRLKDITILRIAICIQIPVLLVFMLSNNLYLIYGISLLKGMYQGLQISVLMNIIASMIPKHLLTTAIILYYTLSVNLTSAILLNLGGRISEFYSIKTLFLCYLMLVFVSVLMSFALSRYMNKMGPSSPVYK